MRVTLGMRITFAFLSLCTLLSGLSGCFVAVGAIAGGVHAAQHNHGVDAEDRASIAKEAALGAVLGLVVDLALVAITVKAIDTIPTESIGRTQ